MKKQLLLILITVLLPLATWADTWQDPETKVNYEYTVGTGEASVTSSKDVSGQVTILSTFTVDGNTYKVTSIGKSAFSNCKELTSITIPSSVTYIGDEVFLNCWSLISLIFFEGVTYIGDSAFNGCKSLTNVTLPKSVVHLESSAFYGCSCLTSVNIPEGVNYIGSRLFDRCDSIVKVISMMLNPPNTRYKNVFSTNTYNNATLYVRKGLKSKYLATPVWNEFNNIEEMEDEIEVSDVDDLQEFLDNLAENSGTEENPVKVPVGSNGMTVDGNVDIDNEVHLLFDGGTGEPLSVNFAGGVISINDKNSSLAFNNVIMTNNAMARSQYLTTASANSGGIINGGKLLLTGCTVADGLITNSGSVYIDGATTVGDMTNKLGGHIYITSPMTKTVSISISEKDIETGAPVILGGNGYTLTAEDAAHISITLPTTYEWKYNEGKHGIVISKKGDPNDDNVIDVADIATIINYMSGNSEGIEQKQVDVNGDGVVDVADIATVISIMAGK